jgi:hypothetical protein
MTWSTPRISVSSAYRHDPPSTTHPYPRIIITSPTIPVDNRMSRKSPYILVSQQRQLVTEMKRIVALPPNHSTLVHDTFGECL